MNIYPTSSESKTRAFRIPFSFHTTQRVVDQSPARFKIVRAGRKWGKTSYARKKALDWMGPPNSKVWYISPTIKQGKLISWVEFKKLVPKEALAKKPNDADLVMTLKNGSELYLMGSDEPDSLRGPAPTGVIFEEAAIHKPEVWPEIIRPNLMPSRAPALFIFTPKGFNWIKDLEDRANEDINSGRTDWGVFHYTVYDNPYLSPAEIDDARRECDNESVWRQEYMAEYESSVGRVFSSFSDKRHVAEVRRPYGVSVYRSIDWGMRDDTAVLWGYVSGGKLFIYREYADNNLAASAQAAIIMAKTGADERVSLSIIGHDAVKQDSEMRGLTVAWHFRNAGVTPLRIGSKNKQANRGMIQTLITEDRLVIDKSCVKLRKQLLGYEWKDTTLEKTEDGNDDLVDSLHSMVELVQYELFASRPKEPAYTPMEMQRRAEEERIKTSSMHRFTLSPKENDSFVSEGSAAGYI